MKSSKYFLSLLIAVLNCKKDDSKINRGFSKLQFWGLCGSTTVTFTATPEDHYVFTNWTNTPTNQTYTTNPLSIAVNENTNMVTNFDKIA